MYDKTSIKSALLTLDYIYACMYKYIFFWEDVLSC